MSPSIPQAPELHEELGQGASRAVPWALRGVEGRLPCGLFEGLFSARVFLSLPAILFVLFCVLDLLAISRIYFLQGTATDAHSSLLSWDAERFEIDKKWKKFKTQERMEQVGAGHWGSLSQIFPIKGSALWHKERFLKSTPLMSLQ